jgi:prolyl oligopeptidase
MLDPRRSKWATFCTLVLALWVTPAPAQQVEDDPFLWLEEVEGERALAWVEARNAETVAELGTHPWFQALQGDLLEILTSDERLVYPSTRGDMVYNFWTDAEHERGIYRRTTLGQYLAGDPEWETVLDIDALALEEGVPWAFGGIDCLGPEYRQCMVALSRGGSDATEAREFDLIDAHFVDGGFHVAEAKSSMGWVDANTLLVATDWGEGALTTSGYARIAKLWTRGTPISEAVPLYEGAVEDVAVFAGSVETRAGTMAVVQHRPSFFEGTMYVYRGGPLVKVDIPIDADPGFVGDQLTVFVRDPWEVGGRTYTTGSVIAIDFESFLAGDRDFDIVVAPGPRQAVQGSTPAGDFLLVSLLDNVQGQLWKYRKINEDWVGERVDAPPMGSMRLVDVDLHSNRFFFTYSSFTQPTTLYVHADDGRVEEVRRLPAMFESSDQTIEQYEAVSADGTQIPYFVVRRGDIALSGENPTLLYGYGGFEISRTSGYSTTTGKAWLERGGVYAVANIRGGGEFGPEWHRAALLENRQRAYDDFIAVAEDLVARGFTSPEHLGIQGGSNGGLLTGVAMTQRPDLFNAVVVNVPLLDMKRYNKLLAGASWMAEYGNPDIPEQWAYISQYSPYQNLHPDREYPRALFTTTTRDDRVHPGHARKMAAKMLDQGHQIFYFENTEGGHGAGVTPEQRARMIALTYTYLWNQLAPTRPIS